MFVSETNARRQEKTHLTTTVVRCVYRQVYCRCDYSPVCTCCCDYIPVCTCFTTMLKRSSMTTTARTVYAMTTLTSERLHCLRPSRSFRLDNVAWRAASTLVCRCTSPPVGGVVEEHACAVLFIPLCQQDRYLLPSRLASMVPNSST